MENQSTEANKFSTKKNQSYPKSKLVGENQGYKIISKRGLIHNNSRPHHFCDSVIYTFIPSGRNSHPQTSVSVEVPVIWRTF